MPCSRSVARSVRQQRQVDADFAAALTALRTASYWSAKMDFAVVQQPPDGGFSIIHAAGGGEAQHSHVFWVYHIILVSIYSIR